MIGGLFGVTAAASAADTAGPDQQAANLSLNFSDQEPTNGMVTVENVSSGTENATVIVTYDVGLDEQIAGLTNGTYADESVQISLDTMSGFPGTYTAYIVNSSNVSANSSSMDLLSPETAAAAEDSQEALVSVDVGNDGTLAQHVSYVGGANLLNDVNGDNDFNILDIQALFANLGTTELDTFGPAFDFSYNGNGEVDIFDVQALYGFYSDPPPR